MINRRQPDAADLTNLVLALARFDVNYVVIGGTAMALHGFPRMTKDIDLLLPIDLENNSRLINALESIGKNKDFTSSLRIDWMNKGFSTALEGEILIDLLYVAAERSFNDLKENIQTVIYNGVPVVTLDIDGMLLTKKTSRESDSSDRIKLERAKSRKNELISIERRIAEIKTLQFELGAAHLFWKIASAAIESNSNGLNWNDVEREFISIGIGEYGYEQKEVYDLLCKHSPGLVFQSKRGVLHSYMERETPNLLEKFGKSNESPPPKDC